MLSSVCRNWRLTLTGWPDSPTGLCVRHQLRKLIQRSSRPFLRSAEQRHAYETRGRVTGVTQLDDVVYVVCRSVSSIIRFSATSHRRLADIDVKGLRAPDDMAGCEQTSQLYVTDSWECVWRVTSDTADIKRWWTKSPSDSFEPHKLSVTSSRILVTSYESKELMQLDAAGEVLRRLSLPDYMKDPRHAVETPSGTFVVSHKNTQLKQWQVSEVSTEGQVLRQFSGPLGDTYHIAIDSQANIFVADNDNRHILMLDAQLALRRVIIDEHQMNNKPRRLCYSEQSGQLLVGFYGRGGVVVAVFDVLQ